MSSVLRAEREKSLRRRYGQPDRPEACPWAWPWSRRPQRGRQCPGRRTAQGDEGSIKAAYGLSGAGQAENGAGIFLRPCQYCNIPGRRLYAAAHHQPVYRSCGRKRRERFWSGRGTGGHGGCIHGQCGRQLSPVQDHAGRGPGCPPADPGRPVFQDAEAAGAVL